MKRYLLPTFLRFVWILLIVIAFIYLRSYLKERSLITAFNDYISLNEYDAYEKYYAPESKQKYPYEEILKRRAQYRDVNINDVEVIDAKVMDDHYTGPRKLNTEMV